MNSGTSLVDCELIIQSTYQSITHSLSWCQSSHITSCHEAKSNVWCDSGSVCVCVCACLRTQMYFTILTFVWMQLHTAYLMRINRDLVHSVADVWFPDPGDTSRPQGTVNNDDYDHQTNAITTNNNRNNNGNSKSQCSYWIVCLTFVLVLMHTSWMTEIRDRTNKLETQEIRFRIPVWLRSADKKTIGSWHSAEIG